MSITSYTKSMLDTLLGAKADAAATTTALATKANASALATTNSNVATNAAAISDEVTNRQAAITGLSGVYGPGSDMWLKQLAGNFGWAFTVLTTVDAATGLPTAGTVKWPDGTTGAFTGTTDGSNGYTTYAAVYGAKTVTASGITYDTATGLPIGPTSLAVA